MNPLDIMKAPAAYASGYENTPTAAQARAKQLCWEYNQTAPNEQDKRRAIMYTNQICIAPTKNSGARLF